MVQNIGIVVVGSYVTDLTFRGPRLPRLGETIKAQSFRMGPGGKGANQAVAAARLGAHVDMVCALGSDPFGQSALENFSAEGLGTSHVMIVEGANTGVAGIVVDANGDNQIAIYPGANDRLTVDQVLKARSLMASAKVLLLQFEIPLEVNIAAAQMARELRVKVVVNPAPAADPGLLLEYADLLTPNETEAAALTNRSVTSIDDALEAARSLAAKVPDVVITMGKQGAVYAGKSGEGYVPSVEVDAVDTTGAGDAFNGALAVAIGEGLPLSNAIEFANRCAAISVTREGTSPAMPYRHEVLNSKTPADNAP